MSPETTLSLEAAVSRFLHSLAEPTRILVAISGGSDSTGLLVALHEALKATPNSEISLCAATVDHDLRAESADEARSVAALCHSLPIPHAIRNWSGIKPKTGIMAAAREARYELLLDAAKELGASLIVTAHTLDDQRETLAMRGKRGTGFPAGIADAVLFDRRIWAARPLLSCLRAEIRSFLVTRNIAWHDDPSNEDMKYERVRMRSALAGEGTFQFETWNGDNRSDVAADAAKWLNAYFRLPIPGLGQISRVGIDAGSPVFVYALSRLAAVFGGQSFPLGREQIDRLLEFLVEGRPGRRTAGRVVFDLRRDGLYLTREDRGILPLSLESGARSVWDGRFLVENISSAPIEIEKQGTRHGIALAESRLPKSAVRRALAAAPAIRAADDANVSGNWQDANAAVSSYFAPFDRFLTRFDLIFADRLAAAFGTRPYPRPPLGLIDGKTI